MLGFKFLKSQLWIPSVKYRSMDLRVVTLLRFKIFQHCKKIVYSIFNIDVVCDSVVERIILILYSGAYSRICSEGSILFFRFNRGGDATFVGAPKPLEIIDFTVPWVGGGLSTKAPLPKYAPVCILSSVLS